MRLLVDTGVFSAALSNRRRRPESEALVARLLGNQLSLAVQTVAELRYGALVAGRGEARRDRLERAISATTVIRPLISTRESTKDHAGGGANLARWAVSPSGSPLDYSRVGDACGGRSRE